MAVSPDVRENCFGSFDGFTFEDREGARLLAANASASATNKAAAHHGGTFGNFTGFGGPGNGIKPATLQTATPFTPGAMYARPSTTSQLSAGIAIAGAGSSFKRK